MTIYGAALLHGREHGGLACTFYPGFDDLPASEWDMARFMSLYPAASELTLKFVAFIPPGAPRQALGLYRTGPGSPFEAALSTF
ncbi:hypothetical protein [Streptomyces sp. NPDC057748]|uniref:hypothetical protein n=1 Tax=unclassified Streptomyces TaxID=2593676 RepID=UPI0036997B79